MNKVSKNNIPDIVFSEKKKSDVEHESFSLEQMHGIQSLTDKEREEIVIKIIDVIVSNYNKDLEREVVDGGIKKLEIDLMNSESLSKYPRYIVHHVLETDVFRQNILNMVLDRPILMSGHKEATVIL